MCMVCCPEDIFPPQCQQHTDAQTVSLKVIMSCGVLKQLVHMERNPPQWAAASLIKYAIIGALIHHLCCRGAEMAIRQDRHI